MIVAVDHGNKQVKTINKTFVSGFVESSMPPPFGEDVLEFNHRYYSLSDQRIPYLKDKSSDNRFFILTLFAIAYEIERRGVYAGDGIVNIQLLVGLPPAHYGALYGQFEHYFRQHNDVIEFVFRNKRYSIYIDEVHSYPQAYSAAMPIFNTIKDISKALVLDWGGFTFDYVQIKNGQADLSVCDSLDNGVIVLYNRIKSKVSSQYDILLDESDIDAIILERSNTFSHEVKTFVNRQAQSFVRDVLGSLRERMIDLRTCQTIFVGGGSILLRRFIDNVYPMSRTF